MTVEEFARLAAAIKTYFPRDNMLPNAESMELWFDMLKDLDYKVAVHGLKKYVSLNKYPPAISDIRKCATSISDPEELNEMEAWALVKQAIRNSGYNNTEEFSKLPPLVQKAVGLPEMLRVWALDENYSEAVTSSNFIKTYRVILARKEEDKTIHPQVRKLIEETYNRSYLAQIDQKRQNTIKSAEERKRSEVKALEVKKDAKIPDQIAEKLEAVKARLRYSDD